MKLRTYILSLALAWSPIASAQKVDPTKAATAEALFREGRAYLEKGKLEAACAKLEESLALDPAIGTRWHLGRCYEAKGMMRLALIQFHSVAAEAERLQRPRQQEAALARVEELKAKVCWLQVRVEAPPFLELETFVDGQELTRENWGAQAPMDCGKHTLEVRANGAVEKKDVVLDKPGTLTSVDAPIPAKAKRAPKARKPKKVEGPSWYGDMVGWSLVAGGVVSGAAAAILLSRSNGYAADARQSGLDLRDRDQLFDDADNTRLWSLVAASAGAALLVGGVFKLGIHEEKPAVTVVPNKGGASAFVEVSF